MAIGVVDSVLDRTAKAGADAIVNEPAADLTMIYVVGGLFVFLYLVVTYIITSSEKERMRMLEKAK
jgi:hypothetical protein